MLSVIVTKLLLNGAIKTLIVKPVTAATLKILPEQTLVNVTLAGYQVRLGRNGLIQFGLEQLFDRYVGSQIDVKIEQLSRYIFGITIPDELREIIDREYWTEEQVIIDLEILDDFLDDLLDNQKLFPGELDDLNQDVDQSADELIKNIQSELDKEIENPTFTSAEEESEVIEKILQSNIVDKVDKDLPEPPNSVDDEIDQVIAKQKKRVEE